jgi:Uma2 family endonuclease
MNPNPTLARNPTAVSHESEVEAPYEIIDGIRVEIPPMSTESTLIASELYLHVANFAKANKIGRGIVDGLFHLPLPMDRNRRPDVAFVPCSRWPQTKRVPSSNAWDVLPDIVAEVISPTDLMEEVLDKIEEYSLGDPTGVGNPSKTSARLCLRIADADPRFDPERFTRRRGRVTRVSVAARATVSRG